ncbi:2-dehydropantoate 2-reductase [Paenibacillus sp. sptzw28]|uniref:ketopantoate reductase family protein n=1 Tax=Paenibacillus sp. sptzw28 TaxID=715179 RepID=UPI001C6F1E43|nr:2-dehydropantoate 2-reductase [Paenibacillus sp. sptzw28]QYR20099.1 2-dehydropantoate 2-reductase [Paenibacillus sp. sptzw28]
MTKRAINVRIIIIGAGSLGLMYAARLARSGVSVLLLTRTEEQAESLNVNGITLEEAGAWLRPVPVTAVTLENYAASRRAESGDWIWLAVKQSHLSGDFMDKVAVISSHSAGLLCLLNGIGHMERLEAVIPAAGLYAAVSTEGALRVGDNSVRYTGRGTLTLGRWPKADGLEDEAQKMLARALAAAGIDTILSNEMDNRLYYKLLINAVINPLTAIYGVTNGELSLDPIRKKLMAALHDECETVLLAAGMRPDGDAWERLLSVCLQTAGNESSMLRDVKAGRTTEIEWINGGISALAKRTGIPSPLNDAVSAIVKALTLN